MLAGCGGSSVLIRSDSTPPAITTQQAQAARVGRIDPADRQTGEAANRFDADCERLEAIEVQQETNVWCWAACAEMIHRYYGRKISQTEIAEKIHKRNTDTNQINVSTAVPDEIIVALNYDLKDRWDEIQEQHKQRIAQGKGGSIRTDLSGYVNSYLDQYSINSDDLVTEIQQNTPLVIGLSGADGSGSGHACVVTGVTYGVVTPSAFDEWISKGKSLFGRYPKNFCIDEVRYIDPWDGQHKSITGADFKERVDFMISKRQAREILEQRLRVLRFE